METTATRLKQIMRERHLRQVDVLELAKPYGEEFNLRLTKSDMSQFVSGKVVPGQWKIRILALALDVSESWLMGYDVPMERQENKKSKHAFSKGLEPIHPYRMKVYGPVAAGVPITAMTDETEYIDLPCEPDRHADGLVRVEGDSMEPRYLNGDLVLIREQDDVEDGQIAAVCIDDRVTLKKVYHIPNGVYLVSENTKYPPMTFTTDDANNIHLLGLAVGYLRWEN